MAVPTITSITPNRGHSGGRSVVTIVGTNFRLPSDVAPTGIAQPAPPSVSVTFGGEPSLAVDVFSPTEIVCTTPKHDLGVVDVVLSNIDDDGNLIGAETVTALAAYTYALPSLTEESDLTRIVRQLIRDMKNQIIPNVGPPAHTDYDEETGDELNLVMVADLPSITLLGPDMVASPAYRDNAELVRETSGDRAQIIEPAEIVDLMFTYVAATDKTITLLNLMKVVRVFFKRYNAVTVDRDKDDPSQGTVSYQVTIPLGGEPRMTTQPNNSNIRSFSGSFLIRGVPADTLAGFDNDGATEETYEIDEVLLDTQVKDIEEE